MEGEFKRIREFSPAEMIFLKNPIDKDHADVV